MYNYYGSYRYSDRETAQVINALNSAGIVGVFLILATLVISILTFIAWCRMFRKAGHPWERLFVPFYGQYWQYKVADCAAFYWIYLFGWIGAAIVSVIVAAVSASQRSTAGSMIAPIILIGFAIALVVLHCIWCVRLAKSYGKSGGFGLGLILLYPIFIMILGFGSAEYTGIHRGNYSAAGGKSYESAAPGWTCPNCRSVNAMSSNTCSRCGYIIR